MVISIQGYQYDICCTHVKKEGGYVMVFEGKFMVEKFPDKLDFIVR